MPTPACPTLYVSTWPALGCRILGNSREQDRQVGNAVTPPAGRDLIAALIERDTRQTPCFRRPGYALAGGAA